MPSESENSANIHGPILAKCVIGVNSRACPECGRTGPFVVSLLPQRIAMHTSKLVNNLQPSETLAAAAKARELRAKGHRRAGIHCR